MTTDDLFSTAKDLRPLRMHIATMPRWEKKFSALMADLSLFYISAATTTKQIHTNPQ